MLKGYKTYVLAGVTAIGAVASYLVGDLTLPAAVQMIVTAGIGATLRSGVNSAVEKAVVKTIAPNRSQ